MTVILRILVAILFLAAPRAAQPVEVSVWPQQQVAQATVEQPGAPLVNVTGKPTDPTLSEWSVLHGIRDQSEAAGRVRPAVRQSQDASAVTFEGTLSWVSPSYGDRYLALPQPRGTRAEICGPADCVTRVSTDYGPDRRLNPDRIADLSAADWQRVCGLELRFGLCPGTVTLAGLPATSTK